ncbi:MAG: helix-turn-helix transcriptional regulator [Pyrinomonadaceae bacterium]|nr:helix-turn-helix transcriptional regulator [Sphingobacteriaceae bacterium]
MLGKKIRLLRLEREYSQSYMAYRLQISQKSFSKIENGKTALTVKRLYDISNILEVSIEQLVKEIHKTP